MNIIVLLLLLLVLEFLELNSECIANNLIYVIHNDTSIKKMLKDLVMQRTKKVLLSQCGGCI